MNTKIEGGKGESLAQGFLKNNGYKIIETNAKLLGVEVDIIAKDKSGTIVFVEVKARNDLSYGHPLEAVTPYKQKRYYMFAKQYIMVHRLANYDFRFDVIGILGDEVSHIENAF